MLSSPRYPILSPFSGLGSIHEPQHGYTDYA
jgi:hypothetical protein